jgi:hypothetical protein
MREESVQDVFPSLPVEKCEKNGNRLLLITKRLSYSIGRSFMSSSPKASLSLRAVTTSEYSHYTGPHLQLSVYQPISPRSSILYLYFAQPAVRITILSGSFSAIQYNTRVLSSDRHSHPLPRISLSPPT